MLCIMGFSITNHEKNMNIQQLEEIEFDAGRQSESLNCLSEALSYAVIKRGPIIPTGNGRVKVSVKEIVYCKATDAIAGSMEIATHFTDSIGEAESWITKNYGHGLQNRSDDILITIFNFGTNAVSNDVIENEDIPF